MTVSLLARDEMPKANEALFLAIAGRENWP
jgi:hypothetical protein